MELFTLGIFQFKSDGTPDPSKPNYNEVDVHNPARACTGWTSIRGSVGVWHDYNWDGRQYDDDGDDNPDPLVIFGISRNGFRIDEGVAGTADDVLGLVFAQLDYGGKNQVGSFLSRKLWTAYAYPPSTATVGLKSLLNSFADVLVANNFELTPLLRAIWTYDNFYNQLAKSRTVKNPVDYVVQAFNTFSIPSNGKSVGIGGTELGQRVQEMGMNLFEPPSVGGWPGALARVNTSALLTRAEFAADLAAVTRGAYIKLKELPGLIGNSAANPDVVVDTVLAQLGLNAATVGTVPASSPIPLGTDQRTILLNYVSDNGAKVVLNLSTDKTEDAVAKLRGLMSLALQTAEHQIF